MAWTTPRTWTTGELVTKTILDTHIRDNLVSILPTGTLIVRVAPYTDVETAVESRWLQCNGVAVSRTTYATLFNYLNSLTPALPFGTGDGSTTFNLPDLRGRTVYAEGTHAYVDDIGDNEGQSLANRGPHHDHSVRLEGAGTNGTNPAQGNTVYSGSDATTQSGGALHRPAYLVVGSYFIKFT